MTVKVEEKENRAKEQAQAQFESIVEMVKRLRHSRDCENLQCMEGKEGGDSWDDPKSYHDEDSARQAIIEDALDVQVRSGWHAPGWESGPEEYRILLCTGGPAVRIIGELNQHKEPESAKLEYQDWFTYWEEHREGIDEDILLAYAGCFYFGD